MSILLFLLSISLLTNFLESSSNSTIQPFTVITRDKARFAVDHSTGQLLGLAKKNGELWKGTKAIYLPNSEKKEFEALLEVIRVKDLSPSSKEYSALIRKCRTISPPLFILLLRYLDVDEAIKTKLLSLVGKTCTKLNLASSRELIQEFLMPMTACIWLQNTDSYSYFLVVCIYMYLLYRGGSYPLLRRCLGIYAMIDPFARDKTGHMLIPHEQLYSFGNGAAVILSNCIALNSRLSIFILCTCLYFYWYEFFMRTDAWPIIFGTTVLSPPSIPFKILLLYMAKIENQYGGSDECTIDKTVAKFFSIPVAKITWDPEKLKSLVTEGSFLRDSKVEQPYYALSDAKTAELASKALAATIIGNPALTNYLVTKNVNASEAEKKSYSELESLTSPKIIENIREYLIKMQH